MFTYNNSAINGRLVNISSLIPQNSIPNSNLLAGILPTSNQLLLSGNVNNTNSIGGNKDSQWLTLEVCKEYQRNACSKSENDCQYAHPPGHLDVQNGRIMCCYDSIKGNCHRIKPPCKYYHPPQHLKDVLIQNGKNNLVMKNLLQQQNQHHHLTLAAAANLGIGAARMNPNHPLSISTPLENSKLSPVISGIPTIISNRSSTPINTMDFKTTMANASIPIYSSTGNIKVHTSLLKSPPPSSLQSPLSSSHISPETISTARPVVSPAISSNNTANLSRKRTYDTNITTELDHTTSKTEESSPAKQRYVMPHSNALDPSSLANPNSPAFLLANQAAAARQNLYLASNQTASSNPTRFSVPISNYIQSMPHQFMLAHPPNTGYSFAPLAQNNVSLSSMLPNPGLAMQSHLLQQPTQAPVGCTSPPGSGIVNAGGLGIPMVNPLFFPGINPAAASPYSLTQQQQQQLLLNGIMGRPVSDFPSTFH